MDIRRLRVVQQTDIAADAHRCFEALAGDISPWWGSSYLRLDRPNTRIRSEPRLGGLVSEHADGEQAGWGTVSELASNRLVTWTGRIGLGDAVTGSVGFTPTERNDGRRIDLEHESIGTCAPECQASFNHGRSDLLHRVNALIEDDHSYGISGKNTPAPSFLRASGGGS